MPVMPNHSLPPNLMKTLMPASLKLFRVLYVSTYQVFFAWVACGETLGAVFGRNFARLRDFVVVEAENLINKYKTSIGG